MKGGGEGGVRKRLRGQKLQPSTTEALRPGSSLHPWAHLRHRYKPGSSPNPPAGTSNYACARDRVSSTTNRPGRQRVRRTASSMATPMRTLRGHDIPKHATLDSQQTRGHAHWLVYAPLLTSPLHFLVTGPLSIFEAHLTLRNGTFCIFRPLASSQGWTREVKALSLDPNKQTTTAGRVLHEGELVALFRFFL